MTNAEKKLAHELETLVTYLNRTRGFDFRGYKRPSLSRGLSKRMQAVGVRSYGEYHDFLEGHPDEFPELFDSLLVNVTGFFRDEPAWTALGSQIERLLERRKGGPPIRVWSAGCASGEEAYTLAMLFCEALGTKELPQSLKIYATDRDEKALNEARRGFYTAKAVESVPDRLRAKYFSRVGGRYAFSNELRSSVIFGRHDLTLDAPISQVDLLSCRNLLIYFDGETQTRILNRLHFALADEGVLFLGRAEMLLMHANLFTPIDLNLRIFRRAAQRPADRDAGRPLDLETSYRPAELRSSIDPHAHTELETAQQELRSTREELETTNEELKSTNEELESTNEELETTNEELHSMNAELHTMNDELRQRGSEVNQAPASPGSILSSVRTGVVVLDGAMVIKAWNPKMEDLLGLRADEVQGKQFLNLDVRFPLELLRAPIRTCLAKDEEVSCVIDFKSRRGKAIQINVSVSPLHGAGAGGVILLFEDIGAGATAALSASEAQAK